MPVFLDVEYVRGGCLFVVLSDGTTGVLDLTPWWDQPLFAAIDTERRCARVFINRRHQLGWPGGLRAGRPGGLSPHQGRRRAHRLR